MIESKIYRDVYRHKEKLVGPFTAKQTLTLIIAIIISVGVWFVLGGLNQAIFHIGYEIAMVPRVVIICLISAIIAFIGFFEKNDKPLSYYIKVYINWFFNVQFLYNTSDRIKKQKYQDITDKEKKLIYEASFNKKEIEKNRRRLYKQYKREYKKFYSPKAIKKQQERS